MSHKCDPAHYMTREEHARVCNDRYDSAMEWAKLAIETGKDDRKSLWQKTIILETSIATLARDNDAFVKKIGGYFIKGLIVIVCVMLLQVFILPKVMKNGEASMLTAIDSKQARQYRVSKTNDENIKLIMQKMGLPYKSPEDEQ